MCNLYTVRVTAAEVAAHFGVPNPMQSNASDEVYPGMPGLVVTENEGVRELRSMTWGFPLRLKSMKPEAKPKPVNNVRELTKGMWVGVARKPQWRCLIPVTHFAEAEGEKGKMTRTWFSLRDLGRLMGKFFDERIEKGVIAKLKPDAVSVDTPSGTIGIRGTQFVVKVDNEE